MPSRALPRPLAFVIALVAVVAALEIGWRIYLFEFAPQRRVVKFARPSDMPASAFRYTPHPYLVYALNPEYRSEDGLDRHNQLGLRGDEIEAEKPAGAYRIICVGGSTTYTSAVNDWRASYPAQLETILRADGGDVEVLNAGVPGYSSFESLIQLELRLLELAPDLVVILDSLNDVPPRLVAPERFASDNRGYRKPWDASEPWWDRLLCVRWLGVQMGFSPRNALEERATRGDAPVAEEERRIRSNSARFFERNVASMIALCRARGVAVLLATYGTADPAQFPGDEIARPAWKSALAEHSQLLRSLAEREGVACFDFAAAMPPEAELYADGRHVNASGARTQAELFAAAIRESFLAQRERHSTERER